jgi:hypothetical protein
MNTLLLTLALLHSADISLTNYGITVQHGKEINPFLPKSQIGLTAVVAAETTAQIYFLHKLNKNHSRIAKTLTVAMIGLEGFIVVHNVQQLNVR